MIQVPVDKATLNALRKAMSLIHEYKPHIQAAVDAGVDVTEEAARFKHLETAIMQFLTVYEPMVMRNPGKEV
jgi:hypothetical protein